MNAFFIGALGGWDLVNEWITVGFEIVNSCSYELIISYPKPGSHYC
jgi:hypothetical protein